MLSGALIVPDGSYGAVFDCGILHDVPDWRRAVAEVHRVLKPAGAFYCEEGLRRCILHPISRRLFEHPLSDRFDAAELAGELKASGLELLASQELWGSFAWFIALKRMGNALTSIAPRSRGACLEPYAEKGYE